MKAKNFIFATSLFLSTVSMFGLTSCQDDFDDDFNHQPEITRTESKDMATVIKANDLALKFYDIKVTYEHNGKTTGFVLDEESFDTYKTDSLIVKDTTLYSYRQCTINKHFGSGNLDITITATPKEDAGKIVEHMNEDEIVDVVLIGQTKGNFVVKGRGSSTKQLCLGSQKHVLDLMLERGTITLEKVSCK